MSENISEAEKKLLLNQAETTAVNMFLSFITSSYYTNKYIAKRLSLESLIEKGQLSEYKNYLVAHGLSKMALEASASDFIADENLFKQLTINTLNFMQETASHIGSNSSSTSDFLADIASSRIQLPPDLTEETVVERLCYHPAATLSLIFLIVNYIQFALESQESSLAKQLRWSRLRFYFNLLPRQLDESLKKY
jgi:hypothetical protein